MAAAELSMDATRAAADRAVCRGGGGETAHGRDGDGEAAHERGGSGKGSAWPLGWMQ